MNLIFIHPKQLSSSFSESMFLLIVDSPVYKKIKAILSTPQKVKAIKKLTRHGQTSGLESYHRMVLGFAPKHLSFGFQGMNAR